MSAAKKRRAGRPPVAKDKAKSTLLSVRFSEAERASLHSAADQDGVKLSEWARRVLLRSATEQK